MCSFGSPTTWLMLLPRRRDVISRTRSFKRLIVFQWIGAIGTDKRFFKNPKTERDRDFLHKILS
jgi:hypothetical protein